MTTATFALLTVLAADPASEAAADSLRVQVRVEGIRGEMRRNVFAGLRLAREEQAGRLLSEGEVRRLHHRAPERIRRALEPFGHYRPEIEGELEVEGEAWSVTYRIDPGDPVTFARVDVRVSGPGAEDPEVARAAERFPLEVGDPFRHARYEHAKRRLQAAAMERGYLDASFPEKRVLVDPDRGTADLRLRLDTGPRFRFGRVAFVGDDLDPEFLQGFVRFRRGEPITTAQLLALQDALQASGLFASVEVELLRERADGLEVPVEVRLIPRPRRRYDAGFGYGTDTGPRAVLGGELRRLTDSGHSLTGELRTSLIQNGMNLGYLAPIPGFPGDRLALTAGILDERTLEIRSTKANVGLGWHRARGSWREAWLVEVQRERSGEGDEMRTSTMALPAVHWTRTEADDPVYPERGYRLRLELAGTHRSLSSDVSFGRALARAGAAVSPWDGGRILLRGEAGSVLVPDVTDLPVSFRFYAGGDRSVRGFAYRSLAPRTEEGVPAGGRHLLVLSGELEQLLWRSFGAAVFLDAGNAENDWPVAPRVGTGLGVRWRSPVGMVRVDLAAAVSEPGNPLRLHLSVGTGL